MVKRLAILLGPTAVGKTSIAITLAKKFNCPIVSADSRQVFKELRIGVARPNEQELKQAQHHLIAHRSIHQRYSAGEFETEAIEKLEEIYKTNDRAIMCGGSLLYLQALYQGIDIFPAPDKSIRNQLTQTLIDKGAQHLAEMLRQMDPETYERIDRANGARIIRALEVTMQTGKPYSQWLTAPKRKRPFTIIKIGLHRPIEELTERIRARVDQMVHEGLIEEATKLYQHRELTALNTIGYAEIFKYLDGEITLENAIESIKVNTRRYAKKQMAWWKREDDITWLPADKPQRIIEHLEKLNF